MLTIRYRHTNTFTCIYCLICHTNTFTCIYCLICHWFVFVLLDEFLVISTSCTLSIPSGVCTLCVSYNVQKSKITDNFSEKERKRSRSLRFRGYPSHPLYGTFSFDHCIVWLPLWYLQNLLLILQCVYDLHMVKWCLVPFLVSICFILHPSISVVRYLFALCQYSCPDTPFT
jgi:hypothetical protein